MQMWFIQVLEDTLVAVRIPAFVPGPRVTRRVRQRERVLLFDVGVRNALVGMHRRGPSPDQLGGVFEQWLILQLVYLNDALRKGWRFSSYRSEGGAEVDLIIEADDELIGIEIKASRTVTRADTRGLVSLSELVPRGRRLRRWLLYRGEHKQRFDNGVEALPFLEAIAMLAG
jgi:predicted AAA+ superfamily ATPase